jgi:hypothetical protein
MKKVKDGLIMEEIKCAVTGHTRKAISGGGTSNKD